MFFSKTKKSSYQLSLNDYEVVVFINFIIDSVSSIKSLIQEEADPISLEKLINERNALMKITTQLGFNNYKEDLKQFKSASEEVSSILTYRNNLNFADVELHEEDNVVPIKEPDIVEIWKI